MTREEFMQEHPDYVTYSDGDISVIAHPRACFFCKHLTDYIYDSKGPYLFMCEKGTVKDDPTEEGLKGMCEMFEKEK